MMLAVRELGYALTDLSRRLGMTQPGVGYAVKRGEQYAEEDNFRLIDRNLVIYLCPSP